LKKRINYQHIVSEKEDKQRLDIVLSKQITDHSRAQIQTWIKSDRVRIDQAIINSTKTKVLHGQVIHIDIELEAESKEQAEDIPLDKCYEDDDLMIINKPAGLVVHPGAGNRQGTLMNALLHDTPQLALLPRAGIVHRLDKDTTGVMMIAKTHQSYLKLTEMLANRLIKREYLAIVDGTMKAGLTINQPIGRHPTHRQKMAVSTNSQAKTAVSHVSLIQRLAGYTLIRINLETGRTHQIRVHMQHIGHPLLGDKTYGHHRGFQKLPAEQAVVVTRFNRQALHAQKLVFNHPISHQTCHFEASIPVDMQNIIHCLSQKHTDDK